MRMTQCALGYGFHFERLRNEAKFKCFRLLNLISLLGFGYGSCCRLIVTGRNHYSGLGLRPL